MTKDTDKINPNKIPWPRKGDRLFVPRNDWWYNACLKFFSDNWDLYAEGYNLAGDLLVEHVGDTHRDQDSLVYPVVFLYRQYLELRLKQIIGVGNKLLNVPQKIPTNHNIVAIWKKCRKILEDVAPSGPKEDLDAVEECINQFSKTDPISTAFRYPVDKKSSPSTPSLTHINLRNLSEVMNRISSLLDGASMGISEYINTKHEMEAEFRNGY